SGMELIRKSVYFGIALLVMKEFNSEEKIKRLLNWLFFACFIATFYGIIQFLDTRFFPGGMGERGLDPFIWRAAFGSRVFSTFGNPNFYGDFLVVMNPIILARYLQTRQLYLAILWLMTAFNAYVTYSKGAWIGFISGFIAFLILGTIFLTHFKKGNIKKILAVFVIGLLIIFIPILIKATKARMDSIRFRTNTWLSCWEMINTKPFLGTGIGTFYVTYPAWRRPQIFFIEGKHNTESDHPENEYLEIWYDEGTIGFAIFLWLITLCLVTGYRNLRIFSEPTKTQANVQKPKVKLRKVIEDHRTYYLLGFLAAFIGMLSHNFVCVSLRFVSSGVFLWLLVGLINIFSIHSPLQQQSPESNSQKNLIPKTLRRTLQVILLIVADYLTGTLRMLLSIIGFSGITIFGLKIPFEGIFRGYFIGDVHHNIAIFHSKRGEWSQALTNYNIVAKNNFGFIMCHYFMGNVFNDRWIQQREHHPEWGDKETDIPWTGIDTGKKGRIDPERSISKYEDVWTLAPNYVQSHHQAGLVYLKLGDNARQRGDIQKAKEYWQNAIYRFERYHAIDPIFAQNYYRLAWIYLQLGELDKAEETYFRHLYTRKQIFTPGADEREWVSKQLGRPVTSILDWCENHKGIYHSWFNEDWGRRRDHEYCETYMNLGNLSFLKNDFVKAEKYYKTAIGIVEENLGKTLQELTQIPPHFAIVIQAMKNLTILYQKTGKQQDALQLWQKIRQFAPNDPDVQKMFSSGA
ncbi:MAG: O-antigen ligase family protein, partial [Elusimicrobiota bacterium]|nr:O-antigen ligase family protein [Elusimicrobiota bacterium]